MEAPHLLARGASGHQHAFWLYPIGSSLGAQRGVYAFCRQTAQGGWAAEYVGQAPAGLDQRAGSGVRDHHKLKAALARGVTHVAAAAFDCDHGTLCWIENDLIEGLRPPLNELSPPGFGRS